MSLKAKLHYCALYSLCLLQLYIAVLLMYKPAIGHTEFLLYDDDDDCSQISRPPNQTSVYTGAVLSPADTRVHWVVDNTICRRWTVEIRGTTRRQEHFRVPSVAVVVLRRQLWSLKTMSCCALVSSSPLTLHVNQSPTTPLWKLETSTRQNLPVVLMSLTVSLIIIIIIIRLPDNSWEVLYFTVVLTFFYRTSNLPHPPSGPRQKYFRGWVLGFSWKLLSDISPTPPLIFTGVSE